MILGPPTPAESWSCLPCRANGRGGDDGLAQHLRTRSHVDGTRKHLQECVLKAAKHLREHENANGMPPSITVVVRDPAPSPRRSG